jgi:hypothetical protein
VRKDGGFGRVAVKLGGDAANGVLVAGRMDDMAIGELRIDRLSEGGAQFDGR